MSDTDKTHTSSMTRRVRVALTEERQGQIALTLLAYLIDVYGLHIGQNERRKLGKLARDTGIPQEEILALATLLSIDGILRQLGPNRGESTKKPKRPSLVHLEE